jgi:hypothetical protein
VIIEDLRRYEIEIMRYRTALFRFEHHNPRHFLQAFTSLGPTFSRQIEPSSVELIHTSCRNDEIGTRPTKNEDGLSTYNCVDSTAMVE